MQVKCVDEFHVWLKWFAFLNWCVTDTFYFTLLSWQICVLYVSYCFRIKHNRELIIVLNVIHLCCFICINAVPLFGSKNHLYIKYVIYSHWFVFPPIQKSFYVYNLCQKFRKCLVFNLSCINASIQQMAPGVNNFSQTRLNSLTKIISTAFQYKYLNILISTCKMKIRSLVSRETVQN